MILHRLLDHDLHRARQGVEAVPLYIDTPAKPSFVPAVVSLTRVKFAVSRKLTSEGKLRAGVFDYDPDRIDEVIPLLLACAFGLSVEEKWPNVCTNPMDAFRYVQKASGTKAQPHALLIPREWTAARLKRWAGKDNIQTFDAKDGTDVSRPVPMFQEICRVYPVAIAVPTFFSRPDFVGLYTQLVGGKSSVFLHNIRNGLAFCP